ncbi:hypothetical protein G9464_07550 [Halostella sp. JP-L12]|uniref:DUF7284 family protein n=1 Tax=Halostella TaxID=1843185 RepID=UPI0013CF3440|nr:MULTISPECIES: hypothetical protein [Halostella]NHN47449.1 hypothetical protein [Halostella sp. JP-L12]
MTDRAVSTVVDAALCLLLVSGAVATLVALPEEPEPSRADAADDAANAVGASTARVNYTLAAGDRDLERSAHGTLAEHLADAAVANASVRGRPLSNASDGFERAATALVAAELARPNGSVAVRARWEPYPDAPIGGEASAGVAPPPGADVHVATLTVPSGAAMNREDARSAADDGYRSVARVAAHGVVETLFPPEETALSLQDPATESATVARYRRAAGLFGSQVDVDGPDDVPRANDRLADALVDEFAGDLASRYDTPRAAADAVAVGEVRITVRAWER